MEKTCKHCSAKFLTTDMRRKFCGMPCCHAWRKAANAYPGSFQTGEVPWNKGTTGVMKANRGSFQKGRDNESKQPIGSTAIRADKKGKERAWVKVSDNGHPTDWRLRAVLSWEAKHGPVPKGLLIHHKNRNTLDDKITNLQAMTRSEHIKEHRHELKPRAV